MGISSERFEDIIVWIGTAANHDMDKIYDSKEGVFYYIFYGVIGLTVLLFITFLFTQIYLKNDFIE